MTLFSMIFEKDESNLLLNKLSNLSNSLNSSILIVKQFITNRLNNLLLLIYLFRVIYYLIV